MRDADWHDDTFPALRPGPPWVMQEMIAAQPGLVRELLGSPPPGTASAAEAIGAALCQHRPVTVCGCGTSEHAAHGVATLLAGTLEAHDRFLVQPRPAFSAALAPAPGACLAISHDGETRASALAVMAARTAGASTLAITHQAESGIARAVEHALVTPRHDDSWCHTVAYTSALAAGAAVAAQVGPLHAHPAAAGDLLERATTSTSAAAIAHDLADRRA